MSARGVAVAWRPHWRPTLRLSMVGWLILVPLALAPLAPWLPMLANVAPWLGLPPYQPDQGAFFWQMHVWYALLFGLVFVMLWPNDRWLAAAVGWVGLRLVYQGQADPTHSMFFAVGALTMVTVRAFAAELSRPARWVLIAVALGEAGYVLLQLEGYDPLWGPAFGGTLKPVLQPFGTLGSVNATAIVLAIGVQLMPLGPMLLGAALIVSMKSLGATLVCLAGMLASYWPRPVAIDAGGADRAGVEMGGQYLYRPRQNRRIEWALVVAAVILAAVSVLYLRKATQVGRVQIWLFALDAWSAHWTSVLFGWGLGGWQARVPQLQAAAGFLPTREWWAEAHNEPLQWMLETGVIGAILLAGWLGRWLPTVWRSPWAGAFVAVLVSTWSWHSFHLGVLALIGVVVTGLATAEEKTYGVVGRDAAPAATGRDRGAGAEGR